MRAPPERVLFGHPRLYASLERQRHENMTTRAEGPEKRHSPITKGPKARNICGSWDVPVLQTGSCIGPFRLGWYVTAPLALGMAEWVPASKIPNPGVSPSVLVRVGPCGSMCDGFPRHTPHFHRQRVSRSLMVRCLENSYPFRNVGPAPSPVISVFIVNG